MNSKQVKVHYSDVSANQIPTVSTRLVKTSLKMAVRTGFENGFVKHYNKIQLLPSKIDICGFTLVSTVGIQIIINNNNNEADSHDQVNMTKNWLEYDQKIMTMTNFTIWT